MTSLGDKIISISVSKVINKATITIVSYGEVNIKLSDKFILINQIEENGIYTKTYVYEDTEDLKLLIEREIEKVTDELYLRSLFRKLRKIGKFTHTRTTITGSPMGLAHASHNPLLLRKISLQDIIGYIGGHPIINESEYLVEYGRNIIGGGDMCEGEYRRSESKRVVIRDYSRFPKVNFIKCQSVVKSVGVSASTSGGSISVIYTTNAVCNIHAINKVIINKQGTMKLIR